MPIPMIEKSGPLLLPWLTVRLRLCNAGKAQLMLKLQAGFIERMHAGHIRHSQHVEQLLSEDFLEHQDSYSLEEQQLRLSK